METDADLPVPAGNRKLVRFRSGADDCVAWHYPSQNGAIVVMAAGLGVTRGPGTDRFAAHFNAAGYGVLAFDFRHLGDSGGTPRQVVRIDDQLSDWTAAVKFARGLPGVDPTRVALWGFSLAGGQVLELASKHPELACAIVQAPLVDGRASTRHAMRHTTKRALIRVSAERALIRVSAVGIADTIGGWLRRAPRLIPLAGPPGSVAMLSTPDAQDADRALNPGNSYPEWQQVVAARSALRAGSYRPGSFAKRVACPLLVLTYTDDQSALATPAIKAAQKAPRSELVQLDGGHYAAFMDAYEPTIEAELEFLNRSIGGQGSAA